jgi:hypothetical protein
MNKAEREQLDQVRNMVDDLAQVTPPTAMFRNGNYTFRVKDEIARIQAAISELLGGDGDGEADGEG